MARHNNNAQNKTQKKKRDEMFVVKSNLKLGQDDKSSALLRLVFHCVKTFTSNYIHAADKRK